RRSRFGLVENGGESGSGGGVPTAVQPANRFAVWSSLWAHAVPAGPRSTMPAGEQHRKGESAPAGNTSVDQRRDSKPATDERARDRAADDGNRPLRKRKPWYRRPLLASVLIVVV